MIVADLVLRYAADVSEVKARLAGIGTTTTEIQKAAKQTANEVQGLANSVQGMGQVFQASIQALGGLGLLRIAKEIVHVAGRADELQRVMYVVGKTAGYNRASMDKYEDGIKKMGIATNEARQSMTKMVQANLDLKSSTDLARAAQDLAVISGGNSSDTFQRMITNIQQMDTLGMRYMGIIVDRDAAEKEYANTLGVATSQLTKMQKTQAFMNTTLVESKKLTGSYEEAMNSWTKTARSTERFVQNLQIALGEGLQKPLLQYERLLQSTLDNITKWNEGTLAGIGYAIGLSGGLISLVSAINLLKFALGKSTPYVLALTAAITALSFILTDEGIKNYIEQEVIPLGETIRDAVLPPLKSMRDYLLDILDISEEDIDWGWVEKLGNYLIPILGILKKAKEYRPTKEEKESVYTEAGVRDKKTRAEDIARAATPEAIKKEQELLKVEIEKLKKLQLESLTLTVAPAGHHSLEAYKGALSSAVEGAIKVNKEMSGNLKAAIKEEQRKTEKEEKEKKVTTFMVATGIQKRFIGIEKLETQKKQEAAYDALIVDLENKRIEKTKAGLDNEVLLYTEAIVKAKQARTSVTSNFAKMMETISKEAEKAPINKLAELNKQLAYIQENISKEGYAKLHKDTLEQITKLSAEVADQILINGKEMMDDYATTAELHKVSYQDRLTVLESYYSQAKTYLKTLITDEKTYQNISLALDKEKLATKIAWAKQLADQIDSIYKKSEDAGKKAKEDVEKWLTDAAKGSVTDTRDAFEIAQGLRDTTGKKPEEIRADIAKLKELSASLSDTEKMTLARNYGEEIKTAAEGAEKAAAEIEAAPLKESLAKVQSSMTELNKGAKDLNMLILNTKLDLGVDKQIEAVKILAAEIAKLQTSTLGVPRVGYTFGGAIRAAFGRFLSGYGGGDKIPVMAEAGEFVHRKEAVKHYGVDFMQALNSMRLPKLSYALGGNISNNSENFSLNYNEGGIIPSPRIKDLMREIKSELKREARRN